MFVPCGRGSVVDDVREKEILVSKSSLSCESPPTEAGTLPLIHIHK